MQFSKNLSWFVMATATLLSLSGKAQELPTDESGKIFFSEVIVADSFPKEKLYANSVRWLKSLNKPEEKFTLLSTDSVLCKSNGLYEFQVFSQGGLLRKMVGSISCQLAVETKDNKYRYAFSEFIYHYYKEDRNYKLLKTGKTKPLEDKTAGGWQKLWDKHKQTTLDKINGMITSMKADLIKKESIPNEKIAKKKVEW